MQINWNILHWSNISFQAYFIGCSFDSFSQSWRDRSYVLTLLISAWLVPLIMIFLSDLGILHRIRNTNITLTVERSKSVASDNSIKHDCRSFENGLNSLERKRNQCHDAKRVISIIFPPYIKICLYHWLSSWFVIKKLVVLVDWNGEKTGENGVRLINHLGFGMDSLRGYERLDHVLWF